MTLLDLRSGRKREGEKERINSITRQMRLLEESRLWTQLTRLSWVSRRLPLAAQSPVHSAELAKATTKVQCRSASPLSRLIIQMGWNKGAGGKLPPLLPLQWLPLDRAKAEPMRAQSSAAAGAIDAAMTNNRWPTTIGLLGSTAAGFSWAKFKLVSGARARGRSEASCRDMRSMAHASAFLGCTASGRNPCLRLLAFVGRLALSFQSQQWCRRKVSYLSPLLASARPEAKRPTPSAETQAAGPD